MESESLNPQPELDARPSVAVATGELPGINVLQAFGGYAFLETFLEGSQNLNPSRKARKKIYLSDPTKATDRAILKEKLKLWVDVLSSSDNQNEMQDTARTKAEEVEASLNKNLLKALTATHDLEVSYRALSLFFKNAEADKLSNVTVVNASFDQLTDLDNSRVIDYIADELKQNYDRLDLRQNYSLLVVPGFMGSNAVLEKWAKIAHANKVMLFTDFADLEGPDDVIDLFSTADMTGAELFRSNVIMTCNWALGREKLETVGETEDLYVPPSAALAGKVYYTLMSQVTAGKKHGGMNEVTGVRFQLRKSELSALERLNLVPMVYEYSRVMAFGGKTLFNGDNLGLQTYSVVRVFDHITKVLFDFLNRRAFENWNTLIEADLRRQIANYLDSIKGPNKLLDQFKIVRLERDSKQKDRIYLDIRLTPYFPAKSFVIRLDGRRGDDVESPEWVSDYAEV
ncbi:type VI secretion system contractile sheath protein TssC [Spirosoma sp.]|uniref:type VI secretion system contractile sheath protein TssC n=1 Tax=Spirosoma sp. TaxID=1899569 RepID=UPI0026058314|nr:type VI secretion system contractile sheath protein TssC [Spirosoma sp.]MCX6219074.1 type VI secretion system contractile sheath protein TssC [Spirosoma sp.]